MLIDDQVFRIENNTETLVAGAGGNALHGDGGLATQAFIGRATGIAIAADSSVYFVDQSFYRVRRVTPSGVMELVASSDSFGFRSSGGLTPSTAFEYVDRVAVTPDGVVYVSGQFHLINQSPEPQSLVAIELDGAISAVPVVDVDGPPRWGNRLVNLAIGIDGVPSYTTGFPGFLFLASLDRPSASPLHESATGRFAIAPDGSAVIGTSQAAWRRILPDGDVTDIPGLTDYVLRSNAIAVGPDGSIYWTDYFTGLWRMAADLAIDRIAGGHDATDPGDGVAAADAKLRGVNEMSFGPSGDLYLAAQDRIRKISSPADCPSAGPRPKIASLGVNNAASYSSIAPGAVFALFGLDIGPAELISAALENDGTLPTELGGTRILFDGVPAPLLFSSKGQVNDIVPFSTETPLQRNGEIGNQGFVSVVAEYEGVQSNENIVTAYSAQPAIFTLDASGSGLSAILNSDGTLNGPDDPAVPGSIIVMWATGAGVMTPAQADGSITAGPTLPQPVTPIGINIGGLPATLAYAGAAPGLAAGVIQVNAYIPPGLTQTGEVIVEIYSDAFPNSLNSVTVYVGGDD